MLFFFAFGFCSVFVVVIFVMVLWKAMLLCCISFFYVLASRVAVDFILLLQSFSCDVTIDFVPW